MKKLLFFSFSIIVSISLLAQTLTDKHIAASKPFKAYTDLILNTSKSAPFWAEDFANGVPATWVNSTAPWVYRGPGTVPGTNVGSQGAYMNSQTPIASATQQNGFILFDSDYYDNNGLQGNFGGGMYPAPHNGELMTDMIDLTGYNDVTLMAHSYFRTFQGQAFIAFYLNGLFVSQVEVHSDLSVNESTPTDAIALVRFPLAVCNQPNVQMKFLFDGTTQSNVNGSAYYFWMLDDLALMETPAYLMDIIDQNHGGWDIGYASTGGFFGMDFTFKPQIQSDANPYMFEMTIANVGANPLHGIQMNVEVLDYFGSVVFNSSSDTTTLMPLDTANYLATGTYSPANQGVYNMRFWANADSLPSSAQSDTSYMWGIITDSVYGRDYDSPGGAWRVGRQCGGLQLGNMFDIYAADEITSVSAYVADYSVVGAEMYGALYEYDTTSGSFLLLAQTDDYVIQSQDRDNWVTISFPQAFNAIPGHYMLTIGGYPHPTDTFGINVSGPAEQTMSRIVDDGSGCNLGSATTFPAWYWITDCPMIRMNFGVPSSPSNIYDVAFDGEIVVYPNPSEGKFVLEMRDVQNDDYIISITNILGETVFISEEEFQKVLKKDLDLSMFGQGIYFINISNSSNRITKKIIVE